jgi:hypothetical protein
MDSSQICTGLILNKDLNELIKVNLFTFFSFSIQVYVAAIRNRNLHLPEDHTELYEIDVDKEAALEAEFLPHRDVFRFYPNLSIFAPKLKTG